MTPELSWPSSHTRGGPACLQQPRHLLSHPQPVLRRLCLCFQVPLQRATHYTHTHISVMCTHAHMGTHMRRLSGDQDAAPWPQEMGSLPGLVFSAWASGRS